MKEQIDNLELWHRVEKTNPKYTKNANVRGNKITSIAPQFQIMNVTSEFGVYGKTWGFKKLNLDYTLANNFGLIVLDAVFFFPGGEFEIKNSINIWTDNAKTRIDSDFAKKLETDTLTKAISKLGFNADIFMGKFDDTKYVAEMEAEFNPPPPPVTPKLNDKQFEKLINGAKEEIEKYLGLIADKKIEVTQVQHLDLKNKLKELKNE